MAYMINLSYQKPGCTDEEKSQYKPMPEIQVSYCELWCSSYEL
jgi:hypothetical protein